MANPSNPSSRAEMNFRDEANSLIPVGAYDPLPVMVVGSAKVLGATYSVGPITIPGIGAAAIYADLDAFGTKFWVDVPKSGVIQSAIMYDVDDEGITTELWLFNADFTETADNAAFEVSDADLVKSEGVISIATFHNAANNQVGRVDGLAKSYVAPSGRLWIQAVTRGTPTIAAGQSPMIALRIVPDAA